MADLSHFSRHNCSVTGNLLQKSGSGILSRQKDTLVLDNSRNVVDLQQARSNPLVESGLDSYVGCGQINRSAF
jgi:hypothetical protein